MSLPLPVMRKARKTPVQERSLFTVEMIFEATIQVLLERGSDRLTTTQVAARAGVSVGTLYQYYPNKQALLFAVLERHLARLAEAVERACNANQRKPLTTMVDALVTAFVDAKMERPEVSMALYAIASELEGTAVVRSMTKRGRTALVRMLESAPGICFDEVQFTATMLFSAMAGSTRAVLEAGASPKLVRLLRRELLILCRGYLKGSARRMEAA